MAARSEYKPVLSDVSGDESSGSESASDAGGAAKKSKHSEETERERQRAEVRSRSRMWQVVDSDGEGADEPGASSRQREDDDDDSRREKKDKKEKKAKKEKKGKKEKKKKRKKESSSSSSDDDDDDSGGGGATSRPGAVNQDLWGKYGIIREADYFRKQREFTAWMDEVKHIPAMTGSKQESMECVRARPPRRRALL